MSLISQALWSAYLPGEMPEDCTYQMFCAAREVIWQEEDTSFTLDLLALPQTNTTNPALREYFNLERGRLIGELQI